MCLQVFHHTWSPIQQYQINGHLVEVLDTHQNSFIPHHYIYESKHLLLHVGISGRQAYFTFFTLLCLSLLNESNLDPVLTAETECVTILIKYIDPFDFIGDQ